LAELYPAAIRARIAQQEKVSKKPAKKASESKRKPKPEAKHASRATASKRTSMVEN
jgi:hypothetical protein